ncbi:uncharacterized protein RJT20DRAFT_125479 [Scheffersomyces xylosifermentans]|uniref:uncharacterized protein n=1 Tax=Scheffersomyces xylosifermentans TaxID=1304137 RepID=UPI00315C76FD
MSHIFSDSGKNVPCDCLASSLPTDFSGALDNFKDIKGFGNHSFGLTSGNKMYNALNTSDDDVTTAQILRVHILRILLTIWTFLQAPLWILQTWILTIQELTDMTVFELKSVVKQNYRVSNFWIVNTYYSIYIFITNVPSVLSRILYRQLVCFSPSGWKEFQMAIPSSNLPETITLILHMNSIFPRSPPSIPQPFLDADKNIQVPDKKEVQSVLSLRNEYFTQVRVNFAAEKVRLLTEVAKFIAWSSFIQQTSSIVIYERFGFLLSTPVDEMMQSIANAVLSELHAFASSCKQEEWLEFRMILPSISIIHMESKTKLVVNSLDNFGGLGEDDVTSIDSPISTANDGRELVVYFYDFVSRDKAILEVTSAILSNMEHFDPKLNDILPPVTDLVFIPAGQGQDLSGFYNSNTGLDEGSSSIFYFSRIPFGFNCYCRSLYFFAMNSAAYSAELATNEVPVVHEKRYAFLQSSTLYLKSLVKQIMRLSNFSAKDKEIESQQDDNVNTVP